MEKPTNENVDISTTEQNYQAKLADTRKVLQGKYDYLTDSSPVVRSFQALTFFIIIFLIPLQVAFEEHIPGDYVISERWDFVFPLAFIVAIGYANLRYIITHFNEYHSFNAIANDIRSAGEAVELALDVTETRHYKLIDVLQNTFIAGTIFTAFLWYMFPDENRLEPLTIIYGFGTALYGYFRTIFNVSNPLDRLADYQSEQQRKHDRESENL